MAGTGSTDEAAGDGKARFQRVREELRAIARDLVESGAKNMKQTAAAMEKTLASDLRSICGNTTDKAGQKAEKLPVHIKDGNKRKVGDTSDQDRQSRKKARAGTPSQLEIGCAGDWVAAHSAKKPSWEEDVEVDSPTPKSRRAKGDTGDGHGQSFDDSSSSSAPPFVNVNMSDEHGRLANALLRGSRVIVLVGAGISTAADLSDFKDPKGMARRFGGPATFSANVYRDPNDLRRWHAYVQEAVPAMQRARPTAFHGFLGDVAGEGRLMRLYTQNIDGLETKLAGLETSVPLQGDPLVVQMHGSIHHMYCVKCAYCAPMDVTLFEGDVVAACPQCEARDAQRVQDGKRAQGCGSLRPRILMYDHDESALDTDEIGRILESDIADEPDVLIVAGSSVRNPETQRVVRDLSRRVREHAGGLAIWINTGPPVSAMRDFFDMFVEGRCDDVASWVAALRSGTLDEGPECAFRFVEHPQQVRPEEGRASWSQRPRRRGDRRPVAELVERSAGAPSPSLRDMMLALDELFLNPMIRMPQQVLAAQDRVDYIRGMLSPDFGPQSPAFGPLREYFVGLGQTHGDSHLLTFSLMYSACFRLDAGFAIRPNVTYAFLPEFAVVATRAWRKGEMMADMLGVVVPLEAGPSVVLSPNAKRSMIRDRHNRASRLMGPISRVNHDCSSHTCELVRCDSALATLSYVELRVVRDIAPGEQITINYGPDYFGDGNRECLCASCEERGHHGWSADPQHSWRPRQQGRTRTEQMLLERSRHLEDTVYSYAPIGTPATRRTQGDHARLLQALPSARCIALHCQMRFAALPEGSLCTSCLEQVVVLQGPQSCLHRYYQATAAGGPAVPLHTDTPVQAVNAFLRDLRIPGWSVYPRAVCHNDKRPKDRLLTRLRSNAAALEDPVSKAATEVSVAEASAGDTCKVAAAKSPLQSGTIWLLVSQWRPDQKDDLLRFGDKEQIPYATVLLVRHQQAYIFDPCYTPGGEEAKLDRLGSLRSLHRVRTMINLLRQGPRSFNLSRGLKLGAPEPLSPWSEYDLSFFSCFELLSAMRFSAQLRDHPGQWARETVNL